MLDSAAIGAIIGAAARAGPEILKFIDRHLDRRHELAMQDKALQAETLAAAQGRSGKVSEKDMVTANQLQEVFGLMHEAYSQQFNTGNPWLNAVSILVRPVTTGVLVGLYVGVKAVALYAVVKSPVPIDALSRAYTENDFAVLSGILTFWFLSRSMEKGRA